MTTHDNDDAADQLRELSKELPALDLDPDAAARIAREARRGPPIRRRLEVILVAVLVLSFFGWAVYKVCEAFR